MKIENLKGPLMAIGTKFSNMGLRIYFVSDKRTRASFNPESFEEMISVYPRESFNIIAHSASSFDAETIKYSDPITRFLCEIGYNAGVINKAEWSVVSENNLEEEFDNIAYEKIQTYMNLPYGTREIVVALDEMYIDTLVAKLDVIENLEERIANDICPYIFKYMETVERTVPVIQSVIKTTEMKFALQNLIAGGDMSRTNISFDFKPVFADDGWNDRRINKKVPIDTNAALKMMYLNLFIMEVMNDLTKGVGSDVEDLKHIFHFFLTETITESKLAGNLMLNTLVSTYVGKEKEGSAFHTLLLCLQNLSNAKVENTEALAFCKRSLRGYYEDAPTKLNKDQLLSSAFLRQYAESHEIMTAVAENTNFRLFAEGILSTKDDADKDMSRVLDVARKASLAEIELQYINTKYSKKDAVNNAYIVVQEIRNTFKKVKSTTARDLLTDIEKNLLDAISKSKNFDHKKERMTINIAYPVGYQG